jgi:hypothetical protein
MRKIYGERYRHPLNALMEYSLINEVPYCDYQEVLSWYDHMMKELRIDKPLVGKLEAGDLAAKAEVKRRLDGQAFIGCNDRFFLLTELCGRKDALHPWLFARCREVEEEPDGYIDLWSRFHFKSSIITFAGAIQEVVRNPEIKIVIFSVVKPTATAFLGQIKDELEKDVLKQVYRDVFYENPRALGRDGRPAKWGLERGITVKRKSNPKEATIEAHGLIDGQPTSRHFDLHIYDDIVTQDHLSPEAIRKTTERWEIADNLGSHTGVRKWMAGTRYHFADTYSVVLERGSMKPRIYPATDDGTLDGRLVLLSKERWEQIKRDQRSSVSAQCLLNPVAGDEATFNVDMLSTYDVFPPIMNVYILVDPSKGLTQRSDRTAIAVIGIDRGGCKYLLDGYRHRMKLSKRYAFVSQLRRKWQNHPGVQLVEVGWERYGKDVEIEAIEQMQQREGDPFRIVELNSPRHGGHSKRDRIERLEPDFRQGRFLLPKLVHNPDSGGRCTWTVCTDGQTADETRAGVDHAIGPIVHTHTKNLTAAQRRHDVVGQKHRIVEPIKRFDEEDNVYDLTRVFIDEFLRHPFASHDDLIDAVSRIYDINPQNPQFFEQSDRSWEGIADLDNVYIEPLYPGVSWDRSND